MGALEWTIKISSRNKENMTLAYLFALGDTAVITSMPKCSHWQCDWSWKQPLNNHHLFGESCLKANHKIRNYLYWKTTDVYREFEYQIQPHIVRKILLNREGLIFLYPWQQIISRHLVCYIITQHKLIWPKCLQC